LVAGSGGELMEGPDYNKNDFNYIEGNMIGGEVF